MKKFCVFCASILALMAITTVSCASKKIDQDDKVITITKNIGAFTSIDVSTVINVVYRQGDSHSMTVKLPAHLEKVFSVEQHGSKLEITRKTHDHTVIKNGGGGDEITVYLVSTRLREVELSGASSFTSESISMPNDGVEFDISGASTVRVNNIKSSKLELDISGASNISMNTVKASDMDLDISGASNINLTDVVAMKSDVEVSGASKLKITGVTQKLSLEVSGVSKVDLEEFKVARGDVEVSGMSKVKTAIAELESKDVSGMSKYTNINTKK